MGEGESIMNFNLVPNLNSTTTVQAMADQCKIYTKLQNFFGVGGIDGQPMLRIAENVNQMLLTKRMPWKFNRVNMGSNNPAENPAFFLTQQGVQDYKHAGATCFSLINSTTPGGQLPAGGAGIDLNPGVYQNGTAKVSYGTFNGGNSLGSMFSWQSAGVVFNPSAGTFTVQFLDPHPFLAGSIGTTPILIAGVVNPAYNSIFQWNGLTQLSNYTNAFTLVAIPDVFHVTLQGTPRQYATITNISQSAGIVTVTCQNQMLPGSIMTFTGVGTNSALNGKTVTLLTASTYPAAGDLTGTIPTATTVTFALPSGVTITNGADTGTIYAAPSGAPGIFNLGWIEQSNVIDINNPSFPLPITPIDAVHRVMPEFTATGEMLSLSCEKDFGNGVVKFRLSMPVSTYPFAFSVVYQARAPKFINGQSVFQWPDDLSWILFEMCLWQGMRFAYGFDAKETQVQMNVAMGAVMSALESEDREANDMSMTPTWPIMR
jgi:hypothetical protein